MPVSRYFGSLVTCSLLTLPLNTAKAETSAQDRKYETVWVVQPDNSLTGSRHVSKGVPVLEQRLLPMGLALTEEDVLSQSGSVLVEKGTQLIQLKVGSGKTFCVAGVPRPSAWRSFMLGGGNLQLCLIDANADGVFDGHFNGGNPMKGVPFIYGKQPKKPKHVKSGKYAEIPPERFALQYTVRISPVSVQHKDDGSAVVGYGIDFGDDEVRQKLSSGASGIIGRTVILGAEWTVSQATDEGIDVEVLKSMPAQPFQVKRYTIYR